MENLEVPKLKFFAILGSLNFISLANFNLHEVPIHKKNLEPLIFHLISRKIWVIEKLLNFYIHCVLESFSQSLFVVWGFRFISSNHYSVSKSWKLKTFTLTMFWQISWKHEISCKRVTFLCFHNVLFVRVSVWNSV